MESKLQQMLDEEHDREYALLNEVRQKFREVKSKRKKSETSEAVVNVVRVQSHSLQKDPDPQLCPETLKFDSHPPELEEWIEYFRAFIANDTVGHYGVFWNTFDGVF